MLFYSFQKGFEAVVKLRGQHIYSNTRSSGDKHEVIATLENENMPNECYRKADCALLLEEGLVCDKCKKLRKTLLQVRLRTNQGIEPLTTVHAVGCFTS